MEEINSIGRALEEANLDELVLRLYLYTRNRLTRMFWRGQREGPIPGGWEIEDFIQAAIKKALNQDRKWKPDEKTLFEFLKEIVSSDINHLAEKIENKIEYRPTTNPEESSGHTPNIEDIEASRSDWPDTYLLKEQEEYESGLIQAQFDDNPIDHAIVKIVIEDGLSRSSDIAIQLGIPVNEVYKAKRRIRKKCYDLRRRIFKVKQQFR